MQGDRTMTIGDAASRSGVPPKTIRFYEEIGLIEPAERMENRYRAYDGKDIETFGFISRARSLGFTLKEVGELLALYRDRRRASKEVKGLAVEHVAQLDRCPILDDLGATTH